METHITLYLPPFNLPLIDIRVPADVNDPEVYSSKSMVAPRVKLLHCVLSEVRSRESSIRDSAGSICIFYGVPALPDALHLAFR
jgi:hypothetical protein